MKAYFIFSPALGREVQVDIYGEGLWTEKSLHLLLLNDGQDLPRFSFETIYHSLVSSNTLAPLVCVGIHAGHERMQEYGIAGTPDYAGRGSRAGQYQDFLLNELLPFIKAAFKESNFSSIGYAGFSLGGLTALDTVWSHPHIFSTAGVFSGSLWWRSQDLGPTYHDDLHRIMHQLIRGGIAGQGLRFYFTTGSLDETADRNGNGVIDSIDDTLDIIKELKEKGIPESAICYTNYENGRHDVATWGRAISPFLLWGWERK